MNLLSPTFCAIVQMDNQQKAVELCGSGLLAGVGRANNAGNVGNANNAYGVAGSNTSKKTCGLHSLSRNNQTAEHNSRDLLVSRATENWQ